MCSSIIGIVLSLLWPLASQALVIPQPRPYEPNVFSVCACEFQDNFWLHLIGALVEHAPDGFEAHKASPTLRSWLSQVQCDPPPLEAIDTVVSHAVGGSPFWDDYRFGQRYHYTDARIRDDFEYNPRIGLATRAACFPGRILYSLLCAHQALMPAAQGREVQWSKFAIHLKGIQDLLPLAVGRETPLDLGHLRDSDHEGGCAALWPWAPIFAGRRLRKLKDYVDRMLSGGINPSMPWMAAYPEPFRLSPSEHARVNPYLQACVPLLSCWPFGYRAALSLQEQCEYCCNPAHGGAGDPSCFDSSFTFETCCARIGHQPAAQTSATANQISIFKGDPSCFDGQFTFELCCAGPQGNPACFDTTHTYDRCCKPPSQPSIATEENTETKVDAAEAQLGDASCFDEHFTYRQCCEGPAGNPACFDATYTFERCCGRATSKEHHEQQAKQKATSKEPAPSTHLVASGPCLDMNRFCSDWARIGECQKNPDYMKRKCRKACGLC